MKIKAKANVATKHEANLTDQFGVQVVKFVLLVFML